MASIREGKPHPRVRWDLETRRPFEAVGSISLTHVSQVTALSDLQAIILKTLIDSEVLGDEFVDGYDLDFITSELESLGTEW